MAFEAPYFQTNPHETTKRDLFQPRINEPWLINEPCWSSRSYPIILGVCFIFRHIHKRTGGSSIISPRVLVTIIWGCVFPREYHWETSPEVVGFIHVHHVPPHGCVRLAWGINRVIFVSIKSPFNHQYILYSAAKSLFSLLNSCKMASGKLNMANYPQL